MEFPSFLLSSSSAVIILNFLLLRFQFFPFSKALITTNNNIRSTIEFFCNFLEHFFSLSAVASPAGLYISNNTRSINARVYLPTSAGFDSVDQCSRKGSLGNQQLRFVRQENQPRLLKHEKQISGKMHVTLKYHETTFSTYFRVNAMQVHISHRRTRMH